MSRAVEVGERVFLRRPAAGDRDEYVSLRRTSRAFLEPWEPRPTDGFQPFGRAGFQMQLRFDRSPRYRKMFICLKEDGRIIGAVNFNGIARGPFQSTTMGYWIAKPYARWGYMTEAIGLALRHAFTTMKLHRVEANIMPSNKRSLGLIRKCGFRFEGLAKRYLQINGRWSDHERWGITIEDWSG